MTTNDTIARDDRAEVIGSADCAHYGHGPTCYHPERITVEDIDREESGGCGYFGHDTSCGMPGSRCAGN